MRAIVVIGLITINLFSMSLSEALKKLEYSNPEINILKERVEAQNYNIINSSKYKNPVLFGGVNDISLSKPLSRTVEPMQTAYIGISQEIVTNGKLEIQRDISIFKKRVLQESLKDLILQTKLKVYNIFYIYKNNRQKIALLRKMIKNFQSINSFHKEHVDSKMAYLNSLENRQKISTIKLKITQLREHNKKLLISLSEILNTKVKSLSFNRVKKKRAKSIYMHPIVKIEKAKKREKESLKSLYIANKRPNITLSISYNYRKNYSDYISLGFKMPLPVRGREDADILRSQKEIESIEYSIKKFINILKREQKISKLEIRLANESIKLINDIIKELKSQKSIILEQDSSGQTVAALKIENHILEQKIKKIDYQNQIELNRVKLRYFGSSL